MEKIKILNISKDIIIAENALAAEVFLKRLKGLMGKKDFINIDGMCIKPCKSIHTFFMKFNIDVIFVDRSSTVCSIIKGLRPRRISPYVKEAEFVIELPEGTIDRTKTSIGDKICKVACI